MLKPTRQPAPRLIATPYDTIGCPLHPGNEVPCGVCDLAGLIAIRCDINDAPYETYKRQGFVQTRSFAVLVFLSQRRPTVRAAARAPRTPADR